jgi:hypothetical protein
MQRIILDLAVEDSYAPSEIVSRIRQTDPGLSSNEAKKLARKTVEEMLDIGLVTVTKLESPGGLELPLDHDAARTALAEDLTWLELPHWRPHPRIAATAAGKEAYYRDR